MSGLHSLAHRTRLIKSKQVCPTLQPSSIVHDSLMYVNWLVQHESELYCGHLVLPLGILLLVELLEHVPANADPISTAAEKTKTSLNIDIISCASRVSYYE